MNGNSKPRQHRAAPTRDGRALLRRPALLLLLAAAGCNGGLPAAMPPAGPAASDALAQVGRWKLEGAEDRQGRPIAAVLPNGRAVHALVFAGGNLAIEGGCNRIGARYRIDGSGQLRVSALQSTLMACMDQELMSADSAVSALLEGSSDWSIAESYPEQLLLQHADGRKSHWLAVRPAPN